MAGQLETQRIQCISPAKTRAYDQILPPGCAAPTPCPNRKGPAKYGEVISCQYSDSASGQPSEL